MDSDDLSSRLLRRCAACGVHPSRLQVERLVAYIGLLTKWNKIVNLTGLSLDPISDDALDRLIVEPLLAASLVNASSGHLVDIGSGGGSPAIPMKIAVPALRLSMIESRTRKSAFLREAIRRLALTETEVITIRLEDVANEAASRESAQLVSVRAIKLDDGAWGAIGTLVAPGGAVLWFRSATEPMAYPPAFVREASAPIPDSHGEIIVLRKAPQSANRSSVSS